MIYQIKNIEWKFGGIHFSTINVKQSLIIHFSVTAASSESNQVGSTYLHLTFSVKNKETEKDVFLEMTLPQFYSFLHELEKTKESLNYLV